MPGKTAAATRAGNHLRIALDANSSTKKGNVTTMYYVNIYWGKPHHRVVTLDPLPPKDRDNYDYEIYWSGRDPEEAHRQLKAGWRYMQDTVAAQTHQT